MGFRAVYGQITKIIKIIKNVEKWQVKTWPWGPLKGRPGESPWDPRVGSHGIAGRRVAADALALPAPYLTFTLPF